jgi:hypothetical protein
LNVPDNDHQDDSVWPIGLTWLSKLTPDTGNRGPQQFLTQASGTVAVEANEADWVLFNNHRVGYYRVSFFFF